MYRLYKVKNTLQRTDPPSGQTDRPKTTSSGKLRHIVMYKLIDVSKVHSAFIIRTKCLTKTVNVDLRYKSGYGPQRGLHTETNGWT